MIRRYKYTFLFSLIILYLSLKSADEFNKVQFLNIPNFDKFVHFCMYFTLMSVVIFESKKPDDRNYNVIFLALFPFLYGILMEILQKTLTSTRNASIYDVIFNTLGILVSVLIFFILTRFYRKKFK